MNPQIEGFRLSFCNFLAFSATPRMLSHFRSSLNPFLFEGQAIEIDTLRGVRRRGIDKFTVANNTRTITDIEQGRGKWKRISSVCRSNARAVYWGNQFYKGIVVYQWRVKPNDSQVRKVRGHRRTVIRVDTLWEQ
jgi:hypothetical protein